MYRDGFFGECLKEIMIERNFSPADLSDLSSVPLCRIYEYLGGKNLPSPVNAVKIADALECSADYLFGLSDDGTSRKYVLTQSCSERVRTAIESSSLSRYRISVDTGISQTQLYRIYRLRQTPNMHVVIALAEYLGCTLDYLTGRSET